MYPRVGSAFRAVRIRRGWRQEDVARRAGLSRSSVASVESGEIAGVTVGLLVRIADALDIRLQITPLWHGAELDRLRDAKHARLAEAVASHLAGLPGWVLAPEVSFSFDAIAAGSTSSPGTR